MMRLAMSRYALVIPKQLSSFLTAKKTEVAKMAVDEAIRLKCDASAMADSYDPQQVESYWDEWWEQNKLFQPNPQAVEKPFCICLPPPNVTGHLHIGHALTIAVEDSIVRMKRMQGHPTLFIPGTDHAGIATQTVAEKKLFKETGLTRHDLGRAKFLDKVWEFKEEHGSFILKQLRRTGASLDWSRLIFTMDDQLSAAVREAFVLLFERGLIYRANRLVNWSTFLRTAISNIEVEHIDLEKRTLIPIPGYEREVQFGVILYFKYEFKNQPGKFIEVATTRIETMLGDVAVAVHPQDERYKHLVGQQLLHPFIPQRQIRVIADTFVDKDFGTGAVKITPAHDHNDYACGQRHSLEFINVFTDEGLINQNGGQFKGMKRFDCRRIIQQELKKLGLFVDKKDNKMGLGLCSRSHDVIQPLIKPQWYVRCGEIGKRMMQVVQNGQLRITPAEQKETWYRWINNLQDWCISRQLWWGHRTPAYFYYRKGQRPENTAESVNWIAARSKADALVQAAEKLQIDPQQVEVEQDEDVLDTWFSSALFPFSAVKWPNTTQADFKTFFPNSMLQTGLDILFFWVARMVMMSLLLLDKLPFCEVLLHPIVCDSEGRKMSKSLGNVIDPLEVIDGTTQLKLIQKIQNSNLKKGEQISSIKKIQLQFPNGIPECGSDALRFGLLVYMVQGRTINLNINRVISYRKFCNKIWNSFKFSLPKFNQLKFHPIQFSQQNFLNSWILCKLNKTIKHVITAYETFTIGEAAIAFHNFWLYELCDVYLQATKPVFQAGSEKQRQETAMTLFVCIQSGLRLLHPMMPFLTEQLYQKLPQFPDKKKSILIAPYPKVSIQCDEYFQKVESDFERVNKAAGVIRSIAASVNLPPHIRPDAFILTTENILKKETHLLATLAKCSRILIIHQQTEVPKGCGMGTLQQTKIFLALGAHIDVQKEVQRLEKKIAQLHLLREKLQKKINDKNRDKIPQNVKAQQEAQFKTILQEQQTLRDAIIKISQLK